jgi:hypothetical protein
MWFLRCGKKLQAFEIKIEHTNGGLDDQAGR